MRSYEVDGLVTKYEGWEFLGIVKDDDNMARGIVAQDMTTAEIQSFSENEGVFFLNPVKVVPR